MNAPLSNAFPLEFDALTKDTVIDQAEVEKIYQVKFSEDPEAYRLKQMQLVEDIRDMRPDLEAHVRTAGRGLRIMTDREAEAWSVQKHRKLVRGMVRNVKARASIDQEGFSEAERAASDHQTQTMAVTALGARRAMLKANRQAALLRAGTQPKKIDG